jgi:colicin V production protein
MAFIDILILVVFAGSILLGLKVGLIRQIGSIAGCVLGLIAARALGPTVSGMFAAFFPADFRASDAGVYASGVLGGVTVFMIVYAVVVFVARSVKMLTSVLLMGPIDRALGAVLSLVQCFVGLSIVLNIYAASHPDSDMLASSRIADGRAVAAVMEIGPALLGTDNAPWVNQSDDSVVNDSDSEAREADITEGNGQE